MGIVGGMLGAAWNALQRKITVYRMGRKGMTPAWHIAEACFITVINTSLLFILPNVAGSVAAAAMVLRLP